MNCLTILIFLLYLREVLSTYGDDCPCGWGGFCKILPDKTLVKPNRNQDCNCHISEGIYKDCNELINYCESNPCQNGGTCFPSYGTYSCSCVPHYDGINCDYKTPRLLSKRIKNFVPYFEIVQSKTLTEKIFIFYIALEDYGADLTIGFEGDIAKYGTDRVHIEPDYGFKCLENDTRIADRRVCDLFSKPIRVRYFGTYEMPMRQTKITENRKVVYFNDEIIGTMEEFAIKIFVRRNVVVNSKFKIFFQYKPELVDCQYNIEFEGCSQAKPPPKVGKLPNLYITAIKVPTNKPNTVKCTITDEKYMFSFKADSGKRQTKNDTLVLSISEHIREEEEFDVTFEINYKSLHGRTGDVTQHKRIAECTVYCDVGEILLSVKGGTHQVKSCKKIPLRLTCETLNPQMRILEINRIWTCNQKLWLEGEGDECDPRKTFEYDMTYENLRCRKTEFYLRAYHIKYKKKKEFFLNVTIDLVDKLEVFELLCTTNCAGRPNPTEAVVVRLNEETEKKVGKLEWKVLKENTTELDINTIQEKDKLKDEYLFTIKANSLEQGVQYTVKAVRGERLSQLELHMAVGPKGGTCNATRIGADLNNNTFNIECSGQVDENLPLKYEVYEGTAEGKHDALVGFSDKSLITGLRFTKEFIQVVITNNIGISAPYNLTVEITKATENKEKEEEEQQELEEISVGLSAIDNFIDHGDYNSALGEMNKVVQLIIMKNMSHDDLNSLLMKKMAKIKVFHSISPIKQAMLILKAILSSNSSYSPENRKCFLLGTAQQIHRMAKLLEEHNNPLEQIAFSTMRDMISLLFDSIELHANIHDFIIFSQTLPTHITETHLFMARKGTQQIVDSINTLSTMILKKLRRGDAAVSFESNSSRHWAKVDTADRLALYLAQDNPNGSSRVEFPIEFVETYKNKEISLQFISLQFSLFWWSEFPESRVVNILMREKNVNENQSLSGGANFENISTPLESLKAPVDIFISSRPVEFGLLEGTVQLASSDDPDKNMFTKVYYTKIKGGGKLVVLPGNNEPLRVLLTINEKPDYDKVINAPVLKKGGVSITTMEVEAIAYVGILPGPQVKPNENVSYAVNMSYLVCKTAVHAFWRFGECWVVDSMDVDSTLHCRCRHLSFMLADFFVPPRKISLERDIWLLVHMLLNIYVFIILSSIVLLLLALIIWARYRDRKEYVDRYVMTLEDNYINDTYTYVLAVYTGERAAAGTTSTVAIKLIGSNKQSKKHLLECSSRRVLKRGADDWFLLVTKEPLGELNSVILWYNFVGKYPDWFCYKIIVYDLLQKVHYIFMVDEWLSILILKSSYSAVTIDVLDDKYEKPRSVFTTNLFIGFRERHMWTSIFIRHPRSLFNRTQKVIIAIVLISLTMLTSLMFYSTEPSRPADLPILSIKLREVIISLECMIISTILTFVVMAVFMQANKERAGQLQEVEFKEESKFKRFILPRLAKAVDLNPLLPISTKTYVRSRSRVWVIMSWVVATLIIFVCWLVSLIYGAQIGYNHSLLWVVTFVLGLLQEIFFFEPIKIIVTSLIVAYMFRKVQGDTIQIEHTHHVTIDKSRYNELLIAQYKKRERPEYKVPPYAVQMEHIVRKKKKENKLHFIFNYSLMVLIAGTTFSLILELDMDLKYHYGESMSYLINNPIRNPGVPLGIVFNKSELVDYFIGTFLPNIHTIVWYNGHKLPNELGEDAFEPNAQILKIKGWTADYCSKLAGVPRLRQHRIRFTTKHAVDILFQPWFPEAEGDINFINEESRKFEENWILYDENNVFNKKPNNPTLWTFTRIYQSHTFTMMGQAGIPYFSGGYIEDLGYSIRLSEKKMVNLYMNNWFDNFTRGIFVEQVFYNVHANLFSSVILVIEHLPSGIYLTKSHVDVDAFIFTNNVKEILTLFFYSFLCLLLVVYAIFKFIEFSKKGFEKNLFSWHGINVLVMTIAGMVAMGAYINRSLYAHLFFESISTAAKDQHIVMYTPFYYDIISNNLIGLFAFLIMFLIVQNIWMFFSFGKYQRIIAESRSYIYFICLFILLYSYIVYQQAKILGKRIGSYLFFFILNASDPQFLKNEGQTFHAYAYLLWGIFMVVLILSINSILICNYVLIEKQNMPRKILKRKYQEYARRRTKFYSSTFKLLEDKQLQIKPKDYYHTKNLYRKRILDRRINLIA